MVMDNNGMSHKAAGTANGRTLMAQAISSTTGPAVKREMR